MCKIRYGKTEEECVREEVVSRIEHLNREFQKIRPEKIFLYEDDELRFEMGLGLGDNKSSLFFVPRDDSMDDRLIAFNPDIDSEDEQKSPYFGGGRTEMLRNIISYSEALEEIAYFLEKGTLLKKLRWHAW